jgi:hypothetical protein
MSPDQTKAFSILAPLAALLAECDALIATTSDPDAQNAGVRALLPRFESLNQSVSEELIDLAEKRMATVTSQTAIELGAYFPAALALQKASDAKAVLPHKQVLVDIKRLIGSSEGGVKRSRDMVQIWTAYASVNLG